MQEESFGPIVGIQKVSSPSEATTLMADTQYGLTAGVYSKSREVAENILSQVRAHPAVLPMVCVRVVVVCVRVVVVCVVVVVCMRAWVRWMYRVSQWQLGGWSRRASIMLRY